MDFIGFEVYLNFALKLLLRPLSPCFQRLRFIKSCLILLFMRGFIVYPTYRISDEKDKALIYLFGRLENGESFLTINEYKPYFYIKTEDQKKAEELITAEFEETEK